MWFVPFLICVIVAVMLTVLVIAVMILAWVGRKRREQDNRVGKWRFTKYFDYLSTTLL